MTFHICIGATPWCAWSGSQRGAEISAEIRERRGDAPYCGHSDAEGAEETAALLRPYFREGAVRVVACACPVSVADRRAAAATRAARLLTEALQDAKEAGSPRLAARIRLALSSAKGAVRNADNRRVRATTQEG